MFVKPKPYLGQHFLKDEGLARRIVSALKYTQDYKILVEIGAGTGILTQFLIADNFPQLLAFEIDQKSIAYLNQNFDFKNNVLLNQDFLTYDLEKLDQPIGIIGNLPYQLSAPIFFKIFESIDCVREVVCLVQKEVGLRLAAGEGSRNRNLLGVLLQTYFDLEYLETIPPHLFNPPPKVHSALIHLTRNQRTKLSVSNRFFKHIVKMGFAHRRKKLKNNFKPYQKILTTSEDKALLEQRAEHLSTAEFIYLSEKIGAGIR